MGEAPGAGAVNYADCPDVELIAAIARRDVQAFEALYERYGDLVYSVTLRVVGDVTAAEDVVQDVFLRLWRRPDHFDSSRGRFITWLLRVARNRAIDELRSRGRRQRHEAGQALSIDGGPGDDSDDPALAALLADQRVTVRRALADIPDEQRLVIELAYFGGLTQQEIATALKQPLGTVKTRIRLGMQKLRLALTATRLEQG
jgi:RNA polymerase sigma-70 factor (ECF subfamily)